MYYYAVWIIFTVELKVLLLKFVSMAVRGSEVAKFPHKESSRRPSQSSTEPPPFQKAHTHAIEMVIR